MVTQWVFTQVMVSFPLESHRGARFFKMSPGKAGANFGIFKEITRLHGRGLIIFLWQPLNAKETHKWMPQIIYWECREVDPASFISLQIKILAYFYKIHKTLHQCLRGKIIGIKQFLGNLNISVKEIFCNDHFCDFYITANLLEIIRKEA